MLQNLRLLREERHISQQALGDAIGVSQPSVNKYENHNIEPDIETLKRMARYFDTSIDYIVGNTDVRRRVEETTPFELNAEEADMLEGFRSLSAKKRECVRVLLDALLSREE